MKKISILITGIVVICSFFSCQKDKNYDVIINRFNESMWDINTSLSTKSLNYNMYDSAGIVHNLFLEEVLNSGCLNYDTVIFISCINSRSGFSISDMSFFRHIKDNYYQYAFDVYGNLRLSFLRRVVDDQLEYQTLVNYFARMDDCKEISQKINVSMSAERFITDSRDYSPDVKRRLLTAMSIYRHSSVFWNRNIPESMEKSKFEKIYNKFDALGEYIALNHSDAVMESYGIDIQDGKDVYRYAGMVSLTAAVCFTYLPTWIFNL